MRRIKSALISVSDKSNLEPLLKVLKKNKIKLISSGGTYKAIKKLKYKNILVEGGSKTISELINNKYIDILQFMIAPILIGSGINSLNLKEISNLNKAIRPKHNFNELENEIIVNLFLNS